jgi:hypothetical protein
MDVDLDAPNSSTSVFDSKKFPKFSAKEESSKSISFVAEDSSSFSDWDDEFGSSSEEKVFLLFDGDKLESGEGR